jgi:hypothetical protein
LFPQPVSQQTKPPIPLSSQLLVVHWSLAVHGWPDASFGTHVIPEQ